jgi:hypothetical protein
MNPLVITYFMLLIPLVNSSFLTSPVCCTSQSENCFLDHIKLTCIFEAVNLDIVLGTRPRGLGYVKLSTKRLGPKIHLDEARFKYRATPICNIPASAPVIIEVASTTAINLIV